VKIDIQCVEALAKNFREKKEQHLWASCITPLGNPRAIKSEMGIYGSEEKTIIMNDIRMQCV